MSTDLGPLDGRHDSDEVLRFAHEVAECAEATQPDRLTTAARKAERGDRPYLDGQRNAYDQTAVVPCTVRALPGAPVATPLSWQQLDGPGLDARRRSPADAAGQARTDPWADLPAGGRGRGPRPAPARGPARLSTPFCLVRGLSIAELMAHALLKVWPTEERPLAERGGHV